MTRVSISAEALGDFAIQTNDRSAARSVNLRRFVLVLRRRDPLSRRLVLGGTKRLGAVGPPEADSGAQLLFSGQSLGGQFRLACFRHALLIIWRVCSPLSSVLPRNRLQCAVS